MRLTKLLLFVCALFLVGSFVSGASLKTFNFDRNRDGVFAGEQDIAYWVAGYEYGIIQPETLLYIADTVPRGGTLKCVADNVGDCFSVPLFTTDVAAIRQGTLFVLRAFGFSDIPAAKPARTSLATFIAPFADLFATTGHVTYEYLSDDGSGEDGGSGGGDDGSGGDGGDDGSGGDGGDGGDDGSGGDGGDGGDDGSGGDGGDGGDDGSGSDDTYDDGSDYYDGFTEYYGDGLEEYYDDGSGIDEDYIVEDETIEGTFDEIDLNGDGTISEEETDVLVTCIGCGDDGSGGEEGYDDGSGNDLPEGQRKQGDLDGDGVVDEFFDTPPVLYVDGEPAPEIVYEIIGGQKCPELSAQARAQGCTLTGDVGAGYCQMLCPRVSCAEIVKAGASECIGEGVRLTKVCTESEDTDLYSPGMRPVPTVELLESWDPSCGEVPDGVEVEGVDDALIDTLDDTFFDDPYLDDAETGGEQRMRGDCDGDGSVDDSNDLDCDGNSDEPLITIDGIDIDVRYTGDDTGVEVFFDLPDATCYSFPQCTGPTQCLIAPQQVSCDDPSCSSGPCSITLGGGTGGEQRKAGDCDGDGSVDDSNDLDCDGNPDGTVVSACAPDEVMACRSITTQPTPGALCVSDPCQGVAGCMAPASLIPCQSTTTQECSCVRNPVDDTTEPLQCGTNEVMACPSGAFGVGGANACICVSLGSVCGNLLCEDGETSSSCALDCPVVDPDFGCASCGQTCYKTGEGYPIPNCMMGSDTIPATCERQGDRCVATNPPAPICGNLVCDEGEGQVCTPNAPTSTQGMCSAFVAPSHVLMNGYICNSHGGTWASNGGVSARGICHMKNGQTFVSDQVFTSTPGSTTPVSCMDASCNRGPCGQTTLPSSGETCTPGACAADCEDRTILCPATSDPVCGNDGNIYSNSCFAELAGVTGYVSTFYPDPDGSGCVLEQDEPDTCGPFGWDPACNVDIDLSVCTTSGETYQCPNGKIVARPCTTAPATDLVSLRGSSSGLFSYLSAAPGFVPLLPLKQGVDSLQWGDATCALDGSETIGEFSVTYDASQSYTLEDQSSEGTKIILSTTDGSSGNMQALSTSSFAEPSFDSFAASNQMKDSSSAGCYYSNGGPWVHLTVSGGSSSPTYLIGLNKGETLLPANVGDVLSFEAVYHTGGVLPSGFVTVTSSSSAPLTKSLSSSTGWGGQPGPTTSVQEIWKQTVVAGSTSYTISHPGFPKCDWSFTVTTAAPSPAQVVTKPLTISHAFDTTGTLVLKKGNVIVDQIDYSLLSRSACTTKLDDAVCGNQVCETGEANSQSCATSTSSNLQALSALPFDAFAFEALAAPTECSYQGIAGEKRGNTCYYPWYVWDMTDIQDQAMCTQRGGTYAIKSGERQCAIPSIGVFFESTDLSKVVTWKKTDGYGGCACRSASGLNMGFSYSCTTPYVHQGCQAGTSLAGGSSTGFSLGTVTPASTVSASTCAQPLNPRPAGFDSTTTVYQTGAYYTHFQFNIKGDGNYYVAGYPGGVVSFPQGTGPYAPGTSVPISGASFTCLQLPGGTTPAQTVSVAPVVSSGPACSVTYDATSAGYASTTFQGYPTASWQIPVSGFVSKSSIGSISLGFSTTASGVWQLHSQGVPAFGVLSLNDVRTSAPPHGSFDTRRFNAGEVVQATYTAPSGEVTSFCVRLPGGTSSTSLASPVQTISTTYLGPDQDRAGAWSQFSGNGRMDHHFTVQLQLPVAKELASAYLTHTGMGGGEYWATASSQAYPLVVVMHGQQVNYAYGQSLGIYPAGSYTLDLFAEKVQNWQGGSLLLTFVDGSTQTISIPASGTGATNALSVDIVPISTGTCSNGGPIYQSTGGDRTSTVSFVTALGGNLQFNYVNEGGKWKLAQTTAASVAPLVGTTYPAGSLVPYSPAYYSGGTQYVHFCLALPTITVSSGDAILGFSCSTPDATTFAAGLASYTPEAFVETLYERLLGRAADADGKRYWLGLLASGTSRASVVQGFLDSEEYADVYAETCTSGLTAEIISSPGASGGSTIGTGTTTLTAPNVCAPTMTLGSCPADCEVSEPPAAWSITKTGVSCDVEQDRVADYMRLTVGDEAWYLVDSRGGLIHSGVGGGSDGVIGPLPGFYGGYGQGGTVVLYSGTYPVGTQQATLSYTLPDGATCGEDISTPDDWYTELCDEDRVRGDPIWVNGVCVDSITSEVLDSTLCTPVICVDCGDGGGNGGGGEGDVCTSDYAPVCGMDLQDYDNTCWAEQISGGVRCEGTCASCTTEEVVAMCVDSDSSDAQDSLTLLPWNPTSLDYLAMNVPGTTSVSYAKYTTIGTTLYSSSSPELDARAQEMSDTCLDSTQGDVVSCSGSNCYVREYYCQSNAPLQGSSLQGSSAEYRDISCASCNEGICTTLEEEEPKCSDAPLCIAPTDCSYSDASVDAQGCQIDCGTLTCEDKKGDECTQVLNCPVAPEGYHYGAPVMNSKGCPIKCGDLIQDDVTVCADAVTCPMYSIPSGKICTVEDNSYDANGCLSDCGELVCEDEPAVCPAVYAPVCGDDGVTYTNACEAEALDVRVASSGECTVDDGVTDLSISCADGLVPACFEGSCTCVFDTISDIGNGNACVNEPIAEVCGVNGVTYEKACTAVAAGTIVATQGACVTIPATCPPTLPGSTVCGADGVSYTSACHAARAETAVAYSGQCRKTCAQQAAAPVCGADGINYMNSCFAGQASTSVACAGSCPCLSTPACVGATCGVVTVISLNTTNATLPTVCGDQICDAKAGETRKLCPADCKSMAEEMCAKRNGKFDSKKLVCVIGKEIVSSTPSSQEREPARPEKLDTLKKQKNQAAVQALIGGTSGTTSAPVTPALTEEEALGEASVILSKQERTGSERARESLFVARGCIDDRLVGVSRILNWLKCVYVPRFLQE